MKMKTWKTVIISFTLLWLVYFITTNFQVQKSAKGYVGIPQDNTHRILMAHIMPNTLKDTNHVPISHHHNPVILHSTGKQVPYNEKQIHKSVFKKKTDHVVDKQHLSIQLTNITNVKFIDRDIHDYIPTVTSGSPMIPHIIHQTWDDYNVPHMFATPIKSWIIKHPTWEYWFWTPESVKLMLQKHYPEYLSTYSNYSEAIFKANIMRYFIMHQYGGVYADLDLESLRPLDNWTMDNECILSENNYVHGYVIRQNTTRAEVMITFLAAKPHHPYFQLAIDMLPIYRTMPYDNKLLYADQVYVNYLKRPESRKPGGIVTVAHPNYFLPTYDKGWNGKVRKACYPRALNTLSPNLQSACIDVLDSGGGRQPKSYSYANHYWEHVIMWGKRKDRVPRISLQLIVPTAKNVTAFLMQT